MENMHTDVRVQRVIDFGSRKLIWLKLGKGWVRFCTLPFSLWKKRYQ